MRLMKLVHPAHGLCAQVVIFGINTSYKIIKDWKFRYGKKFEECTIEIEEDEKEAKPERYVKKKPNGAIQVSSLKSKRYTYTPY